MSFEVNYFCVSFEERAFIRRKKKKKKRQYFISGTKPRREEMLKQSWPCILSDGRFLLFGLRMRNPCRIQLWAACLPCSGALPSQAMILQCMLGNNLNIYCMAVDCMRSNCLDTSPSWRRRDIGYGISGVNGTLASHRSFFHAYGKPLLLTTNLLPSIFLSWMD